MGTDCNASTPAKNWGWKNFPNNVLWLSQQCSRPLVSIKVANGSLVQHKGTIPALVISGWVGSGRLTCDYNAISVQLQLQLPTGTELGKKFWLLMLFGVIVTLNSLFQVYKYEFAGVPLIMACGGGEWPVGGLDTRKLINLCWASQDMTCGGGECL